MQKAVGNTIYCIRTSFTILNQSNVQKLILHNNRWQGEKHFSFAFIFVHDLRQQQQLIIINHVDFISIPSYSTFFIFTFTIHLDGNM